jgi:small subunit ribosomal protein S6
MLTEYETTVVIRPDINGDSIESTLDRIRDTVSQRGGKLIAINHWGKKKLAYEIEKQTRGIYVHTNYLGGSDMVAEIERNLRISDNVLRYLTVKLNDGVAADTRQSLDYVRPEYDKAEEVEREEEPREAGGGRYEAEEASDLPGGDFEAPRAGASTDEEE